MNLKPTRVGVKESCNCSFKILSHCTAQRGSQQKIFRGRQNINFLFKHLPIHFRQFCSKTQARFFENCLVVTVGSTVPCFVVFSSFTDAFPAVFLAITFVCLSFPSQNRDLNFPAALGETAGKASEEVY